MNQEYVKDISKAIKDTPIQQELSPGSPRRYEPAQGISRHNERIHRESKYADTHKNLPFSFRKVAKPVGRNIYVKCDSCGHITSGTTATVGIVCNNCKKFSTITKVEDIV